MTNRKYSVAEIDRMREALWDKAPVYSGPRYSMEYGKSAAHTTFDEGVAGMIEDRLRIYMLAGVEPEELEKAANEAGIAEP